MYFHAWLRARYVSGASVMFYAYDNEEAGFPGKRAGIRTVSHAERGRSKRVAELLKSSTELPEKRCG